MQDEFLLIGRQFVERHFQTEFIVGRQRPEHLEVIDVAPVPAANRAFGQGQLSINQALDVEELLDPQAVTGRAGTGRVVEGKQLGLEFTDGVPANWAGEARGEDHLFARLVVHRCHQGDAICQFQRGLEGFGQALLQVCTHLEAVDHDINGVFFLFIELRCFVQLIQLAVDPGTDETLCAQFLED
ncbi:hypothetical protein D3C76_1179030 [compost metagenome]